MNLHDDLDLAADASVPAELRLWLNTDHRKCSKLRRLEAIEEVIDHWVPVSRSRDVRLDSIERRLAKIEEAHIPDSYSCVADLAARVGALEEVVRELRRRLVP